MKDNTMDAPIHIDWKGRPDWLPFDDRPLAGDVHVIRLDVESKGPWLLQHQSMLEESEREKLQNLVQKQDQLLFLGSRILSRFLCADYAGTSPEEVNFDYTPQQKPFLQNHPEIHFNTAHSGEWVVFIFSEAPGGIDIEQIDPQLPLDGLMEVAFHPAEIDFVTEATNQRETFYRIWTLKESLLKTTGIGLTHELKTLNVLQGSLPPNLGELSEPYRAKSMMLDETMAMGLCHRQDLGKVKFFDYITME